MVDSMYQPVISYSKQLSQRDKSCTGGGVNILHKHVHMLCLGQAGVQQT